MNTVQSMEVTKLDNGDEHFVPTSRLFSVLRTSGQQQQQQTAKKRRIDDISTGATESKLPDGQFDKHDVIQQFAKEIKEIRTLFPPDKPGSDGDIDMSPVLHQITHTTNAIKDAEEKFAPHPKHFSASDLTDEDKMQLIEAFRQADTKRLPSSVFSASSDYYILELGDMNARYSYHAIEDTLANCELFVFHVSFDIKNKLARVRFTRRSAHTNRLYIGGYQRVATPSPAQKTMLSDSVVAAPRRGLSKYIQRDMEKAVSATLFDDLVLGRVYQTTTHALNVESSDNIEMAINRSAGTDSSFFMTFRGFDREVDLVALRSIHDSLPFHVESIEVNMQRSMLHVTVRPYLNPLLCNAFYRKPVFQ